MEKNIKKAIEKEKEYLDYRKQDKEPFHLVDAIKEFGFESLDEYFRAKKKQSFVDSGFAFIEKEPISGIVECIRLLALQKPFVLFANSDVKFVFHGNSEINREYCEKNDIPIVPIHTNGGAIVNLPGDFSFCICCKKELIGDASYILEGVRDILQKYTDKPVSVDNNDILVDGLKVCGSASYNKQKYFMFVGYFSFSDKSKLISNICTTTKVGKDVGFIDFIDRDILRQEVKEWLQIK
jgi:lipoate-protein ligase A